MIGRVVCVSRVGQDGCVESWWNICGCVGEWMEGRKDMLWLEVRMEDQHDMTAEIFDGTDDFSSGTKCKSRFWEGRREKMKN
jgi:hypothetical protein